MNFTHCRASCVRWLSALAVAAACSTAHAQTPAEALLARHAALGDALEHNAYQRPLYLESSQDSGRLQGDIYAVVDHPFATLATALKSAGVWCDILILHLNVKGCAASGPPSAPALAVDLGKKEDQPADEAYRVDFAFRVAADMPGYLDVLLGAESGPLGTRDYRIALEAVPLDSQRTFMHLSYAYRYGVAARLAMQGYLSTLGRNKVGFSVVGQGADGSPVRVGGVRGVIERNTMRYYLAIDVYLDSLRVAPADRLEWRLRHWFAETQRYALQLHELDEAQYMTMKRKETQR